jgi:phytoene synthase
MSFDDARHCERLTRRHARTFYLASLLLPGDKRRGAYSLYAFCRLADDLVDCPTPGPGQPTLVRQLDTYRHQLDEALAGRPAGPVFRELQRTVSRFGVTVAALHELLDGVALDLTSTVWETWPALEAYCQGVAGSVGHMCVRIFGDQSGAGDDPAAIARARSLGVAMQLTNILRDVGEDARRGRCYLPVDELAGHGLTPGDILHNRVRPDDPRWQRVMGLQVARARRYFAAAQSGIPLLDPDARRCASACAIGYARILVAIERSGYDSLHRRASLGWIERTAVLGRCLLGSPGALTAPEPATDDRTVIPAA